MIAKEQSLAPSTSLARRAGVSSLESYGGKENPINHPILESLVRVRCSRYKGFEHVSCIGDVLKPKNAPANWVSKVDYDVMLRLDPSLDPGTQIVEFEDVNDEIRGQQSRDIQVQSVNNQLSARSKLVDLINPGGSS